MGSWSLLLTLWPALMYGRAGLAVHPFSLTYTKGVLQQFQTCLALKGTNRRSGTCSSPVSSPFDQVGEMRLQGLEQERASSRILATWQTEAAGARNACESLDLGPISPPAHVLTQHQALMRGASFSPLADISNTPRLDSSSDSSIQQASSYLPY